MLCPDLQSPPKTNKETKSIPQKAFILYKFANSVPPHVQCIVIIREPQAQLELGFYSSKGGGEGFLRFRTPDWLTFV